MPRLRLVELEVISNLEVIAKVEVMAELEWIAKAVLKLTFQYLLLFPHLPCYIRVDSKSDFETKRLSKRLRRQGEQ